MSARRAQKRKANRSKRLVKKLEKRAKASSAPSCEGALVTLASESWRLMRLLERVLSGELGLERAQGPMRFFGRRMEEVLESEGLIVVADSGQDFDPGLPFQAVNLGDFDPEEALAIDVVLEPAIVGPNGVKKAGSVVLKRKEA